MSQRDATIHPTAVVEPGARIADDAHIGPFCRVGPGVVIEAGVQLLSHVVVEGATRVGAGTRVFPFVTLGMAPQDYKYRGEDTSLTVGARCEIREGVTIHRASVGATGNTGIGDGCMIMAMAHVGHDCQLGAGVILANNVMLGGHVHIGEGAFIGGGVAVHQTVRIGRLAMVSGMAGVTNDVPPFGYVFGQPARLVGFNKIGLLRRRTPREQLKLVRAANQLLFKDTGEFAARLAEAETRFEGEPLVAEILTFIRDPARQRQLVRPGRMAAPELGPVDDENGDGL